MHSGERATILVVDDEAPNRRLLERLLAHEGYRVVTVDGGGQAIALATAQPPDLILLDVMMPEMDGFEVSRRLKSYERTRGVPIIMVTALDDRESRLRGLEAGAEDFLSKPVDRAELGVRVRNLLRLKEYSDFLIDHNRILEQQVAARTADLLVSHRNTIATLTRAAAFKDEETGAHVARISYYTVELARTLGMDDEFCDTIHYASPMHDIGKIAIPDALLGKPGALDRDEWEIMKTHTTIGARMIADAASPYLQMGECIAASHHERWDGSGYPNGLTGETIPLPARLMQICDVYDALRSRRPYKPAFDHARTIEIISRGDGRTLPAHFDPQILDAALRCAHRFNEIFEAHRDDGANCRSS